ncbi:MAG: IS66 family transposase [Thermodesulfobacteriota bacterium]|nr:IS66 family transposase [Thermodesulfobacteriota bacterium]
MSVKRKLKRRKKRGKKINLDMDQLDELLKRAESGSLQENDIALIKGMAECIAVLSQAVDDKASSVKKLLRMVFGAKTEKKANVLSGNDKKDNSTDNEQNDQQSTATEDKDGKKRQGSNKGKNGVDKYTGADQIEIEHPELKVGDSCPECTDGKLYKNSESGVVIRVTGSAPLRATVYKLEKLRCDLCGKIFTAPLPKKAGNKKYDTATVAMIALLKYGSGLPFNRIQGLQANLGIPLPSSTQWDIINRSVDCFKPAYKKMVELAAQGDIFHNDDTTIKIQSLIKENKQDFPARKGMYTTGIVSIMDGRKIVLFLSGRKHAGENLNKVLAKRDTTLQTPLQMCDALSRNTPNEFDTILAFCLVHARRHFVDAVVNFPEECQFVINILAEVYYFDAETKEQDMTPEQRLRYHQENSAELMEELELWLDGQIEQKNVEPNSSLGDAIYYMLNHWEELTAFLRIPGAPLDNNICERALKKAILHRKNSLFYKSEHGAAVGDMFMSLIYTCEQAGTSPFDYLKALQDHAEQVKTIPSEWMPWNFSANLTAQ